MNFLCFHEPLDICNSNVQMWSDVSPWEADPPSSLSLSSKSERAPCGQIHCIKLRSHNLGKAAMCQALCWAFTSMSCASPVSWIQPCVQGDPDSRSENQLLTGAHPAPQGLAFPKVSGCLQTDTFIFPSNLQLLFPCCKFSTLVPVCQLKPTWLLH